MKIQLDTEQKTIKVEENVNLQELMAELKKRFPNGEWKEYQLTMGETIIGWPYPVYPHPQYSFYPQYPITPYTIECGNGLSVTVTAGTCQT